MVQRIQENSHVNTSRWHCDIGYLFDNCHNCCGSLVRIYRFHILQIWYQRKMFCIRTHDKISFIAKSSDTHFQWNIAADYIIIGLKNIKSNNLCIWTYFCYSLYPGIPKHNLYIDPWIYRTACPNSLKDTGKNTRSQMFHYILFKEIQLYQS